MCVKMYEKFSPFLADFEQRKHSLCEQIFGAVSYRNWGTRAATAATFLIQSSLFGLRQYFSLISLLGFPSLHLSECHRQTVAHSYPLGS